VKVLGLAGWSGSGKTTLLVALLPELTRRGLAVSTVKHAHHAFDVDRPGKDSWRHREAGAREVLISSGRRWALMHELRGAPEPRLDDLLARLSPVDLVLVEGFKAERREKLEVWRRSLGKPLLAAHDPQVMAVASDAPVAESPAPVLDLNAPSAIADFLIRRLGLRSAA
jgi:molybdopterin-guanine dinucleotide biosynthesis adapter protein